MTTLVTPRSRRSSNGDRTASGHGSLTRDGVRDHAPIPPRVSWSARSVIGSSRPARHRWGDPVVWATALALSGLGLLAIYSATGIAAGDETFVRRQLTFLAVSVVLAVGISRYDYRRLASTEARRALVVVTVGLLAAVLTPLGVEHRGTRGWLPVGALSLQPAELAKISFIVVLAGLFATPSGRRLRTTIVARRFLLAITLMAVLSLLVLVGGETGTVLVYGAVAATMLAGADVPKRWLGLLLVSGLVVGALLLTTDVLAPYQRDRIESFLDPAGDPQGSGYHQRQSLAAIGSGGLAGKGLFNGPQTQLRFLPEQHTDFVFAVVGEELGFAGGLTIIVVQGLLLARVLALARPRGERFGELLCLGIFGYLAFQVVQNVAMNLRLLPVTGIPLPFVSYGGSSLLTSFVAMGLVQSVARHRRSSAPVSGSPW